MSMSSVRRADTFGASSATPGTSDPGFEALSSPNGPNSFFFQRSHGWSRLVLPGGWSLPGSPRRLKPVDGWSSSSHVRKTNTPFLACSGMRPWTPEMAFLTEATPAHEFQCGLLLSTLPDCRPFHLQGPHIVVLSLNPLMVSNQHSASRLGSPLILLHRSQL